VAALGEPLRYQVPHLLVGFEESDGVLVLPHAPAEDVRGLLLAVEERAQSLAQRVPPVGDQGQAFLHGLAADLEGVGDVRRIGVLAGPGQPRQQCPGLLPQPLVVLRRQHQQLRTRDSGRTCGPL
jgi:hypothetical protein